MHIAIKSVALQLCQISSKSEMVVRTFVRILDQLRWNDSKVPCVLDDVESVFVYNVLDDVEIVTLIEVRIRAMFTICLLTYKVHLWTV